MSAVITSLEAKHKYKTLIYNEAMYRRLYNRLPLTTRPSKEIMVWCFFRDATRSGNIMAGDLDLNKQYPVLQTKDEKKRDVVAVSYRHGRTNKNFKIRFGGPTSNYSANDPSLHYPEMYIEPGRPLFGVLMTISDYGLLRKNSGLGEYQRVQTRPVRGTGGGAAPGPSEPRQTRSSSRRAAAAAAGGARSPRAMSRSPSPSSSSELDYSYLEDFPSPGRPMSRSPSQESELDYRPLVDYDELPVASGGRRSRSRSSSISDMSAGALQEAENVAGGNLSPRSQFIRDLGYYRNRDPRLFHPSRFGKKNKRFSLKQLKRDLKRLKQ